MASAPVSGSRSTKHFWLARMVARITSPGISKKARVEFAHQHHRPFDQSGDLIEQALVLDQLQPLRESQVLAVMQDDVASPRRIEHDLGFFQSRQIIVESPHFYRLRRHETVAICDIASGNAANFEGHDLGVFGFRPECGENGMQRAHPAQAIGSAERTPQRIALGQGKVLMMLGRISASTSSVKRPSSSRSRRNRRLFRLRPAIHCVAGHSILSPGFKVSTAPKP